LSVAEGPPDAADPSPAMRTTRPSRIGRDSSKAPVCAAAAPTCPVTWMVTSRSTVVGNFATAACSVRSGAFAVPAARSSPLPPST
jgi:hypothetical protein